MITKQKTVFILFFLVGALALTGCPPKKKLVVEDQPTEEETVVEEEPTEETAEELKESEVEISQDWTEIPALGVINFGYDSTRLGPEQRKVLKRNVAIIKKLPKSVKVRVAGHCDDRGTIEYNIALGQRRANSIRSFYRTAGISASRIKTISFGEERPLCSQATDACWQKNRRGETQVRNDSSIKIDLDELK